MRFLIVCALMLIPSTFARAATAAINGYGFSVTIPDRYSQCGPDWAGHGVGFYLDGRPAAVDDGCAAKPTRRVVTVFADMPQLASLESEAATDCAYSKQRGGIEVQSPPKLELGNRSSIACTFRFGNEWIEILVVTECGLPPPRPHSLSVVCNAWLHTTPRSFPSDLLVFRTTLGSVKFFEPHD